MSNEPIFLSGAYDNETDEKKLNRFQLSELAYAPIVEWIEKPQNQWRSFPIRNQNGSGTCVTQTLAKLLGINNFNEEKMYIELSAYDGYQQRQNPYIPGCNINDVIKLGTELGLTLQNFAPDQELTEEQANLPLTRTNSMRTIAKMFKGKNVIFLNGIEEIAFAIASGKGVMLWFSWEYSEWDIPVPTIKEGSLKNLHHSVSGVDFTLYQGKKAIIIDDSWGKNKGLNGQRVITEDWFIAGRNTIALYIEDLSNLAVLNDVIERPIYKFERNLSVGMSGYDVAMLQKCLGYLKDADGYLFPLTTEPTGYYGGITRNAVKRFQQSNNLTVNGVVDKATRERLNSVFS